MTRLVVAGDALLDRDLDGRVERLCPEAPVPVVEEPMERTRAGGAGLAAVLAARDGHDVTLVTALSSDAAGHELRSLLDAEGVRVVDLGLAGATPEKVRVRCDGRLLIRLDHGAPGRIRRCAELPDADAVLVADYGRGVADALRGPLEAAARRTELVWDPHPNGREPVTRASLVTPNAAEALRLATDADEVGRAAVELRERWSARAVAITVGERGAVLAEAGAEAVLVPCEPAREGDPCGAGDRFASTAAAELGAGASIAAAVADAAASAARFVREGGAGALATDAYEPRLERVVATGGCFDLLHAGHVRMLESARALGERLVVLLNSDESVRRLKGPGRPLVGQDDRAAVLRALGCVDEVVIFDEQTPVAALERLRPAVWVKGGDYAPGELPEAEVVARHGGRVEILPYVEGRSTTRLIQEALRVA